MNFNNNKVRKVINHVSTSWLSLGKCLDGPIVNDPDEKPSREKMLVNAFKQPASMMYSVFVQSVIPIFDSSFLQAEEP